MMLIGITDVVLAYAKWKPLAGFEPCQHGSPEKIWPFAFQGYAMCKSLTMTVMLHQVVNLPPPINLNERIEFE